MNDDMLASLSVPAESTIGSALRRMDEAARKVVLVTDEQGRLAGIATDGDIRRWILSGRTLDNHIEAAMNPDPLVVEPDFDREDLRQLMVESRIESVPVVDEDGHVVDVIWWTDFMSSEREVERPQLGCPVVVMAGGRGARLAPYTHVLPKPLIPLGEQPILDLIMQRFASHGCCEFHVSLGYKADLIRAYLADSAYKISYYDEDEPLGTVGSLAMMSEALQETFFLSNCDILVDADYAEILEMHRASGHGITLVVSAKHVTIPYGVCEVGPGGRLVGMKEKPALNLLVSTGMYVIEPALISRVPDGRMSHLTDLVDSCLADDISVGVYPVSEESWIDVGQMEQLQSHLRHFSAP